MSRWDVDSPWTDEKTYRLRELWDDPANSCAAIGRELGVTKNAVIGKAHRLNLPPRESPLPGHTTAPKPPPLTAARRAHAAREALDLPRLDAQKQHLPRPSKCCWPIGEPGKPGFFCDRILEAGLTRTPYCREHTRAAYLGRAKNHNLENV